MGRPGVRRLVLLAACLELCGPRGALGASFYGESYVGLSITEVSSRLSLQLRFQTSKPQGLLFLAAGKIDYCLIELLSGILQVKINLGVGEQILLSEQRLRVDNLVWHSVELDYGKDNVFLVIDKHYETTGQLRRGMHNFTFHHGIYVGGHGGLSVPYLDSKTPNFRGCIEGVVFNQREILTSLRSYPGFKKVYEVSLGCSEEFFAGKNEAISFFSSRSYVAFPEWRVQGEGILRFAVQTETQQAMLLFQSGRGRDFVALEIHEGRLKAHVGRGETETQLSSFTLVSDNKWHVVQLRVTRRHLDLTVDEHGVRAMLPPQSQAFVSEGPLFVGGLDHRMWETGRGLGLVSVPGKSARGISLKGCLRALEANLEKRALRDALVSKDISAGCTSESVHGTNPSVTAEGLFQPEPSPSTVVPSTGSPLENQSGSFLVLNKLEVQEGGRALLRQKHINVNVDFMDLGINDSQILFQIQEMPAHGFLQIDVWSAQEKERTFTLLDLRHGKVWYVHDGSEEPTDAFTFWVFSSSKKAMPSQLQDPIPHVFNIIVIPVNDPPYLKLPEGHLLLFENSKKQLTPNVVQVSDPDTESQHLRLSVLSNFNADAGFLEHAHDPGRPINGFTHVDLQEGNIFYVHRGHRNSRIVLRATDGELVSNTVVLRVTAVPWDFEVADRNGVVVPQGGTVLITKSDLSVKVNGEQHELDTRYDITRPPQFGQIQHRGSNGEWKRVSSFFQRSVDQGRIRYYSSFKEQQQENVTDHFKFKVSIEGRASKELLFPVTVQWLKLTLLKNIPLEISGASKKILDSDHLQAATEGVEVAERELYFKLLIPPKKGNLLLSNEVLKTSSVFSQKNITDSKVSYEPQGRPREHSQDTFSFSIVVEHIESKDYTFRINLKAEKTHVILINTGLFVKEGEWTLISKSELFVQTSDNHVFQYEVTKRPQHGELKLLSSSTSRGSDNSITGFTEGDIEGGRLIYVHDDSETQHDEFIVLVSATELGQQGGVRSLDSEHMPAEIKVSISVELKNDEKPVRVVDKVFHVVRDSQRLLTLADLCFHDPDLDFDDGQLLYTRRGIPNGDLVKASDPTQKLYQFRQEDLQEGRVLFRHHGPDSARFLLFVTDGVHYTSSLLEVSVSEAYVHIVNNTGLLVHRGRDSCLTTANLSVTTNQDVRTDHEYEFRILQPPRHGRILVNNSVFHSFSQHDLKQGHVIYRHNGDGNFDVLNLTVKVKDAYLDVSICVQVSLESHQRDTQILHTKTLIVEEGKQVKLSRGGLQAGNEDDIPLEAVFIVRTPPVHGYLEKSPAEDGSVGTDGKFPLSFTQQDIDDGDVLYVQTAPGQRKDQFTLDVTKGSHFVRRVEVHLDIIPEWIPLEVQNFTVREGGSKALLQDHLRIPSKYFESLDCEFILLEPPNHGYIESSSFPRVKLMKFSRKQVEQGLIYYVHNGSEESLDSLTVLANSSELGKQSLPRTLFVTVESVNDQIPVITANKILQVWVNSVTEMTRDDLCAEDGDSSPQDLVYWVTPPSNGHLALKSVPGRSVQNFTQAQIDEGQLVFVHSGAMSGGFNFQVTDGLNFAPRQIFSITARALIISLEVNRGLSIFPSSTKALSSHALRAVTSDDKAGNRTITFTVVSPPRLGRLLKMNSDNRTEDVSVFTQRLVSEGLILYQHVDLENTGWASEDSFTFTASSPPAALGPEDFRITISYEANESGRQSRLLANTGASVKEGGEVLIDQSKLDASNLLLQLPQPQRSSHEIWFQVTALPCHGTIMVGDRNITTGKPYFSQHIVNAFGVTYLHDDSESLADNFTFAVWPNPKNKSTSKPEADFLEEMFNITINPVNDQPPELKTKGLRLTVLQGSRLVVGPEILKVDDLDSPPNEIRYVIIRHPNNGFLAMAHDLDTTVQHFTQADINNAQVWFIQDGSPSSGVFYFSVTDGEHRPLYKLFHLDVIPITITLVNLTDLLLPQGQTTASITNAHLSAVTNGRSLQIVYRMTQPLQSGHLLIGNQVVTSFGQEDLDSGRLSYHMTNLTASGDQLRVSLFTAESNLTERTLGIRVQPLLRVTQHLKVANGVARQLQREDLDATELASKTNSDPTFEVTRPPTHGRLVRRAVGSPVMEEITRFTQRDINRGELVLEPCANLTGTDGLNDSFTFLLSADRVQPATGYLAFTIVPPDPFPLQTSTPHVPLFITGESLVASVFFQKKLMASVITQTETPGNLTQIRWRGTDSWGQLNGKEPEGDGKVFATEVIWPHAATKAVPGEAIQPRDSGYPLMVIIPLGAVFLLLVVTVVALCVWLLSRKEEKANPLLQPQRNLESPSPSGRAERSGAIPTVTVTPLMRSASSPTPSLFLPPRWYDQMASPGTEPVEKCAPWEAWVNLDPDMAKLCRQTNPALKQNQYWV
ncbi:chondroitin sulfate proteoglycan 4-like isoform X1 [Peromyscus californicus insignis]|uniref:chondroitin sulfate proteoglycan 4-like isoform X1 n=1 Tax=Peromyscus californicus insignis TaxID=564181 RepID=UPI0022A695F4|nr:chondroitin sulfate proteoglycan 4-like isoform X1 [Peromyscus californicus insignis]